MAAILVGQSEQGASGMLGASGIPSAVFQRAIR